jgi:Fe-Mn family superoxide dismutase
MAEHFTLLPLPYPETALAPVISADTVAVHYHKHHQTYVDTLNKLVEGTRYADMSLLDVMQATVGGDDETANKIFNNAGQVWNHDFYWRSLSPQKTSPGPELAEAIERDFGSFKTLTEKLIAAGISQFGSGWTWLVCHDDKLAIEHTANADNPKARGINCLLGIDVWEHAYYLDYRNERAKYLSALPDLLNWDFAAENLSVEAGQIRCEAAE